MRGTVTAEFAVVGAGYTGLSAALHLREAGRDVVVVDSMDVGDGASGRNGGQVIPGLKHDPSMLEQMFGADQGSKLSATVAAAPDLVFDLIRRHQISCDAVRSGWLQLATSETARRTLNARARLWQNRGADVRPLDAADAESLTGSRRYCGGLIDHRGGTVQPLLYVRGLALAAQRLGVGIFAHSAARSLEQSGGGWRIGTDAGAVMCRQVILATDAFTDQLVEPLRRSLVVVPSYQVATAPIPASLRASILPQGQAVSDTWRLLRYFRLDATGRLVMGSRGLFGQPSAAVAARGHRRAIEEIYPQLSGIELEYQWGGPVAMTPDHLPHLHQLAPGLVAGLGFNGRGVAMATVLGKTLARWVLGEPVGDLGFPISPLRPIRLHRFSRLGVRLAIQYFRMLDGVGHAYERIARRDTAA